MRLEMDQTKPEREPNVEGHQRELDVQERVPRRLLARYDQDTFLKAPTSEWIFLLEKKPWKLCVDVQ